MLSGRDVNLLFPRLRCLRELSCPIESGSDVSRLLLRIRCVSESLCYCVREYLILLCPDGGMLRSVVRWNQDGHEWKTLC